MDPVLHLSQHQARVDASLRRHRVLAQRPRPPGRSRRELADGLRRLADRLEPAPAARPA